MKKVLFIVLALVAVNLAQVHGVVLSTVALNSATNTSTAFAVHDSCQISVQAVDSLCAAVWLYESSDKVNYVLQSARIDSVKFTGGGIVGYRLNSHIKAGTKWVKVRLIGFSAGNSVEASTADLTKVSYKDFRKSQNNY
jgi:hypothetical protein